MKSIQLNQATKDILRFLWVRKVIGGKHTPEGRIMKLIAHLSAREQNEVINEWEYCIKQLQWVFRMKKTGEWHVTLNPKKLREILESTGGTHNGR